MATVLGIHGIGQRRVGAPGVSGMWAESLARGVTLARGADHVPSISVPYFARVSEQDDASLGSDLQERPLTQEEAAWIERAIEELVDDHHLPGPDFEPLGPPAVWKGYSRGLVRIDQRYGRGRGETVLQMLREVHAYLFDTAHAERVRARIVKEWDDDTRLVLGHSLGSVVGYDLLRQGLLPGARGFVTIGSPLMWPSVRRGLNLADGPQSGLEFPWHNVLDPYDAVTGGWGLGRPPLGREGWGFAAVTDARVHNGVDDPHAARAYLRSRTVGGVVADALADS